MEKNKNGKNNRFGKEKLFTLSQFRRELGVPLVVAKKLVNWGEVKSVRAVDGTLRVAESEVKKISQTLRHPAKRAKLFFRALGPGFITGAADDDPSGIGTYSAAGAKFGFSVLWMALWLLPMMTAIQEISARIGIVTNKGLAGAFLSHFKKRWIFPIILLLILANIINIGADLGAMAASLEMLTGINFVLGAVFFAFLTIFFEVFIGYHIYVKILKWLAVSVLSYVVAGFMVSPDWKVILENIVFPKVEFNREYFFAVVAIFGTTITPYLFFWQASGEVEEKKMASCILGKKFNSSLRFRIAKMRTDVRTGMILANAVFFFIIIVTAQNLFANGIYDIDSPEKAALALRPFAGDYAYSLFAFGIIFTGLLAVPILAGSGAYAISEMMKWKEGLDLKFYQARGFYLVIAFSIIFGLALNFSGINPIKALYWSAFINGVISLPLLVLLMILGGNKKVMGAETHPAWVRIFGWMSVVMMFLAVVIFFVFAIIKK